MAQLLNPIDFKNVTEHYTSSVVHYYYKSLYSLQILFVIGRTKSRTSSMPGP